MAGEICPMNSCIKPMNQDAAFLPGRGNRFSLSPGERAGVRVSVKLIVPRVHANIEARYYLRLTQLVDVMRRGKAAPAIGHHPRQAGLAVLLQYLLNGYRRCLVSNWQGASSTASHAFTPPDLSLLFHSKNSSQPIISAVTPVQTGAKILSNGSEP